MTYICHCAYLLTHDMCLCEPVCVYLLVYMCVNIQVQTLTCTYCIYASMCLCMTVVR